MSTNGKIKYIITFDSEQNYNSFMSNSANLIANSSDTIIISYSDNSITSDGLTHDFTVTQDG